jgi:hypothetical protein
MLQSHAAACDSPVTAGMAEMAGHLTSAGCILPPAQRTLPSERLEARPA